MLGSIPQYIHEYDGKPTGGRQTVEPTCNENMTRDSLFHLDKFYLLVYSDNNNDGIKESLHHTNFNNQKIICQYTNGST